MSKVTLIANLNIYENYFVCIDLTLKSAEVIIICAFKAHFIKEVSRAQLCAAAKSLLTKEERKGLANAEKSKFLKPLAQTFLDKEIVTITNCKAKLDVTKSGTF